MGPNANAAPPCLALPFGVLPYRQAKFREDESKRSRPLLPVVPLSPRSPGFAELFDKHHATVHPVFEIGHGYTSRFAAGFGTFDSLFRDSLLLAKKEGFLDDKEGAMELTAIFKQRRAMFFDTAYVLESLRIFLDPFGRDPDGMKVRSSQFLLETRAQAAPLLDWEPQFDWELARRRPTRRGPPHDVHPRPSLPRVTAQAYGGKTLVHATSQCGMAAIVAALIYPLGQCTALARSYMLVAFGQWVCCPLGARSFRAERAGARRSWACRPVLRLALRPTAPLRPAALLAPPCIRQAASSRPATAWRG